MAKKNVEKMTAQELKSLVKAELLAMHEGAETGKKVTSRDAEFALKAVAHVVAKALKNGKHAGIQGLGTWELRERGSRKGRNPQTGEALVIAERTGIGFTPSASLKNEVK